MLKLLTIENITFEKKIVAQVVMQHFPDLRKTLNECQKSESLKHRVSGQTMQSNQTTIENGTKL